MGAGRAVSIVEVEARACPLRQLRRCFHSYRASSVPRSGLGSCDRRHGLLFEYPSFFRRPCAHAFFGQTAKCEVAHTSLPASAP
jgi:hypothetical protein